MKPLNVAIIGYGKMGRIRHASLAKRDDCVVEWICESDAACGAPDGCHLARDPDVVLRNPDVDAVVMSTPNQFLAPFVVAALDAGKHVFCEKPPGRSVAELQEMIAAERRNPGTTLVFGFNHRHHASMIHAKAIIDSKAYGDVLWMRGRYGKSVDQQFFSGWRADKERAGGGIFLDQGIHMLDLFLMMVGDFDEAKAFVSNCYWKLDIEDNVFALFRNRKGQVASLHSTMTQWRHLFSLEIFLERGYITINGLKTSSNTYGDETMTIAKNRSTPPAADWTDEEHIVFPHDDFWDREIDAFVRAVHDHTPIRVGSTDDAMKLMRLVELVYRDSKPAA